MINFTGEICAIENFEDERFSHADFALGSSWSREYEVEKGEGGGTRDFIIFFKVMAMLILKTFPGVYQQI